MHGYFTGEMEAGKQMRFSGKMDWKVKQVLFILCGVLLVIGLLFGIMYWYFVRKLTTNNEEIVRMGFQQTEKDIKYMMETAQKQLNRFSNDNLAWAFSGNAFSGNAQRSGCIRKIIDTFDGMLASNMDAYGFAILTGDGRAAVSTAEGKCGTGKIAEGELEPLLSQCRQNYPYVFWASGWEADISPDSPLYRMVNRPVLLGFKAIGEDPETGEDIYLLVALDEKSVENSFAQAVYNGSDAVLLDEGGTIISSTRKELLGTKYQSDSRDQNIAYNLFYRGWRLMNRIPKESYLGEARDIRNFGITLAVLASLGVLGVSLVWSCRYTRPIQNLMEQMESVGRECLDIAVPVKAGLPELDHLNEAFYATVQKLKSYIHRVQQVEQEKAREELLALQYQINPHFLYNSLNSIRWMAMMTNNTKVADSLVTLSRIIMPILRDPSFTWKLENELEFLKSYVEIMQLRFGPQMEYHVECGTELYEEMFPRFILQPVIENCFVHGCSGCESRHIHVSIRKEEGFSIEIRNTGIYVEEEKIQQINQGCSGSKGGYNGIGLANVRKRLGFLYGDRGRLWMASDREKGTFVYLTF
jgi:sensor histidine kinase YesM